MTFGFDLGGNRLIAGARAGRKPSYLTPFLYVISSETLNFIVSAILGVLVFVLLILPTVPPDLLTDAETVMAAFESRLAGGLEILLSLPQFLLMIGYTWLWVRLIESRPFRTIGLASPRKLGEWARGMAIGIGLFLVSVVLIALNGDLRWAGFAPAGLGPALLWTVVTLLFFLIQGPAEEIMARGYLLPVLTARGGLWVGVIVSSLVFAAAHLLNPNLTLLSVVDLPLFGILAALYALREESLWGVFGLHTAWNWLQGNVLGLPVSGASLGPAPLFDLDTVGPAWWGGGAFGPEGGLVVTIPTLAAIALLLLWKRLWKNGQDEAVGANENTSLTTQVPGTFCE